MPTKALIAAAAGLLGASVSPAASVGQMQGERRVLIVAAPVTGDARLATQRWMLAGWARGAADRDVTQVTILGDTVTGADDDAQVLRRRYRLATGAFAVVLIGKDGHEALRSDRPVVARALEATIDAMPMRRAGQR
jgi:hypothetical protein